MSEQLLQELIGAHLVLVIEPFLFDTYSFAGDGDSRFTLRDHRSHPTYELATPEPARR